MRPVVAAFLLAGVAISEVPLAAQCFNLWLPSDGSPGTNNSVYDAVLWDPDLGGPSAPLVVVGGDFDIAGNIAANSIAAWNTASGQWTTFGAGIIGYVTCVAVTPGNQLLMAGYEPGTPDVTRVRRWTGSSWVPVGGDFTLYINAMTTLPNGDIVVGGNFTSIGAAPIAKLARWNGTTWTGFGAGTPGTVEALSIAANGDLLVGGVFAQIDGVAANGIARWNGATWSALGGGIQPIGADGPRAIAEAPNGDVYVGGFFPMAGGVQVNNVARWDGVSWSALASGVTTNPMFTGSVKCLRFRSNGDLLVGGVFSYASGQTVNSIARWTGANWAPLGPGFQPLGIGVNASVDAIVELPNGGIVAGGSFRSGGGQFGDNVSRWDGSAWRAMGAGFNDMVLAIVRGIGDDHVVGGSFTTAGGVTANRIARWNGTQYVPMGSGLNGQVRSLLLHSSGDVYAGGQFTTAGGLTAYGVARWNGANWSPLGSGATSSIDALVEMPNGDVVAGGSAYTVGGLVGQRLARWNGSAWSSVGGGVNGSVTKLLVRPDGTLVALGAFTVAGTTPVSGFAAWNGVQWSPLTGPPGGIVCLANALDGGLLAANLTVSYWNGQAWTQLPGLADGSIQTVLPLPGGEYIVVGLFTSIGGVPANRIARWNGVAWTNMAAGLDYRTFAATLLSNGQLVLGGMFSWAGGQPAPFLARLGTTCPPSGVALGAGCPGSTGVPLLQVRTLPMFGSVFRSRSSGLANGALVLAVSGFITTSLPLDSVFAAAQPGCTLFAAPDLVSASVATNQVVEHALAIPLSSALISRTFHHQHVPFEFDVAGNLGAVSATNAWSVTIGKF